MKSKPASSKYAANSMNIFRVTPEEKNRLAEQAEIAGLSYPNTCGGVILAGVRLSRKWT